MLRLKKYGMKITLYTVCNIHKESNFLSLSTLLFINKYNCISLDQMKKNDIFLHLLYPPNTAILAQLCQKCKIYGGKWVLCFISTFEPQSNVQFSLSAQVLYVSHRVLDTCKQIKDDRGHSTQNRHQNRVLEGVADG